MLAKIQALFISSDKEPDTNEEYKLQLAAAVLLLEIAKADSSHDLREEASIRAALQNKFSLSVEEVDELFEDALKTGDEAISLHRFIKSINQKCDDIQKAYLIEQMWEIAYADNNLDKHEDYNIRKIADLLYVPHRVFIQTKQKVSARRTF